MAVSAFGEDQLLFGGHTEWDEMATKVAGISTTSVDQHPVVISNYNRPDRPDLGMSYRFQRAEMKVSEAARATSAAPPYFKPYQKPGTNQTSEDGAPHHKCPIKVAFHEQNLIWDDVSTCLPDMLVSIDTGCDEPEENFRERNGFLEESNSSIFARSYRSAHERLDGNFDCRYLWDTFMDNGQSGLESTIRFVRINFDQSQKRPKLDDVSQISTLDSAVRRYINTHGRQLEEIDYRLVASSFFFETEANSVKQVDDEFICRGHILCRIADKTPEMKALGMFLKHRFSGSFEPFFVVSEDGNQSSEVWVPLTDQQGSTDARNGSSVIGDMCIKGLFLMEAIEIRATKEMSSISISICLQDTAYQNAGTPYLLIAGFPRELMNEDSHSGFATNVVLGMRKAKSTRQRSRFVKEETSTRALRGHSPFTTPTRSSVSSGERSTTSLRDSPATPVSPDDIGRLEISGPRKVLGHRALGPRIAT